MRAVSLITLISSLVSLLFDYCAGSSWPNEGRYPLDQSTGPRIFNLRDSEHPDFIFANKSHILQKYPTSSASEGEYFRVLGFDGENSLIVGGANAIHNVSLDSLEPHSVLPMKPSEVDRKDCLMAGNAPPECRNFIRIAVRLPGEQLLACGTNAYKPRCQVLQEQRGFRKKHEFSGIGLTPFDPKQNYSYVYDPIPNELYVATMVDFAGNVPLIYRYRLNISNPSAAGIKTQQSMLDEESQFVGAIDSEKYVYFFYREAAVEEESGATYSRVARICKTDKGGIGHSANVWTSFVKARLNCSIPERSRNFYFDQIVSISEAYVTGGRRLIYATFVSEFDFLRHSVVCAYDLDQIDEHFRSAPFLTIDPDQRRWTKTKRDSRTEHLGQCQPDSRTLSEDELAAMRRHSLLAGSIPSAFGRAVGIHRENDHYNQIVAMHGVPHQDGVVDLIYVATDQGNVIKMLKTTTNSGGGGAMLNEELQKISVFWVAESPIRQMLVDKNQQYILVVTDTSVIKLPTHFCEQFTSCNECIRSDPHCAWHQHKCVHYGSLAASADRRADLYQDVFHKKPDLCKKLVDEFFRNEQGGFNSGFKISEQSGPSAFVTGETKTSGKFCDCLSSINQRNQECSCFGKEDFADQQFLHLPGTTPDIPIQDFDVSTIKAYFPWWVLLILLLALVQTFTFTCLCCRYLMARRRAALIKTRVLNGLLGVGPGSTSGSSTSTLQFQYQSNYSPQAGSLINAYAYSPPSMPKDMKTDEFAYWMGKSPTEVSPQNSEPLTEQSSLEGFSKSSTSSQPKSLGGHLRRVFVKRFSSSTVPDVQDVNNRAGEINIQLEGSATPSAIVLERPIPMGFARC